MPTRKLAGWSRTYACNWLAEGFRIGWHETHLTLKAPDELPKAGLQVMHASIPGWVLHAAGKALDGPSQGPFGRGTFATLAHPGGSVVVMGGDDGLTCRLGKEGRWSLH